MLSQSYRNYHCWYSPLLQGQYCSCSRVQTCQRRISWCRGSLRCQSSCSTSTLSMIRGSWTFRACLETSHHSWSWSVSIRTSLKTIIHLSTRSWRSIQNMVRLETEILIKTFSPLSLPLSWTLNLMKYFPRDYNKIFFRLLIRKLQPNLRSESSVCRNISSQHSCFAKFLYSGLQNIKK